MGQELFGKVLLSLVKVLQSHRAYPNIARSLSVSQTRRKDMKNMTMRPNFGHRKNLIHPIVPTVTVTNACSDWYANFRRNLHIVWKQLTIRSDSRIPGHSFTYPWTFYRTRHMKTKGSILIQRDANKWPGILESSRRLLVCNDRKLGTHPWSSLLNCQLFYGFRKNSEENIISTV